MESEIQAVAGKVPIHALRKENRERQTKASKEFCLNKGCGNKTGAQRKHIDNSMNTISLSELSVRTALAQ